MSGGHFDYNQYRVGQIAEDIEELIANNDDATLDEWGCRRGRGYPVEILDKFRQAVATLREAEIMTQRIDYLVSGDDGEDSFLRRWDAALAKAQQKEAE